MGNSSTLLASDSLIDPAEKVTRLSGVDKFGMDLSGLLAENLQLGGFPRILEVGFGNGKNLSGLAKRLPGALLVGVDDSMAHFSRACRRNRKIIEKGLLELHLGKLEQLPYPRNYFDGIYLGNIWNSWNDLPTEIWKLRQLLKPQGRLVMFSSDNMILMKAGFLPGKQSIRHQYYLAGFSQVRLFARETGRSTVTICVGLKD